MLFKALFHRSQSLDLIEKGIHPLRIASGFEKACEVAVKKVEEISKVVDIQADVPRSKSSVHAWHWFNGTSKGFL